jgi:pepF/M3 family oligoendopeptidase
LTTIYPSFDSPQYQQDEATLDRNITLIQRLLNAAHEPTDVSFMLLLNVLDDAEDRAETLSAYAEALYTTDTRNERALAEINKLEYQTLPLKQARIRFRSYLVQHQKTIYRFMEQDAALDQYRFFVTESIEKAAHQMPPELENLANDLLRSGGNAWSRLHEALTSTLSAVWDSATGERKTVTALRELAYNPDRAIRRKAYQAELAIWQEAEIPIAACLNGVKGSALTMDQRRNWETALQKSAFQSRIQEDSLETLIAALESSLPLFRRYLRIKARLLNIPVCTFYDLFAPVGSGVSRIWTWEETEDFIVEQFTHFDPAMGAFAEKVFASHWIDAETHDGKVGGAYCTDFPLVRQPRILCNFEGSFDSVMTVAHELGHAWHTELMKGLPRSLSQYPMTLAETASIFAETIVFEGAIKNAAPAERLELIEASLKDCCQVIVDILSRFYFEEAVFEQRKIAELSPVELCELMIDAQKHTYGDALDSAQLHPYMWAVKSHYYSPAIGFYNYPYAFGQLFSLCLYDQARTAGSDFIETYRAVLTATGQASVEEVAQIAGIDITGDDFWRRSLDILASRLDELDKLRKALI